MSLNRTLRSAVPLVALAALGAASPRPSPREVVLAKFEAASKHDIEGVAAYYAQDAVLTAPDLCGARRGREEVRRTYHDIFAAVPDIRVEVDETVAQGNRVAIRLRLRGTAGGRPFALPLMDFLTVRGGLIVRDHRMFDNGGRAGSEMKVCAT